MMYNKTKIIKQK